MIIFECGKQEEIDLNIGSHHKLGYLFSCKDNSSNAAAISVFYFYI